MSRLLETLGEAPPLEMPLIRPADPAMIDRNYSAQFQPEAAKSSLYSDVEDVSGLMQAIARVAQHPEQANSLVTVRYADLLGLLQQQQAAQPQMTRADYRLLRTQERIRNSFANGGNGVGTTFDDPIALRIAGGLCGALIGLLFIGWMSSQTPTQQQYSQTAAQLAAIERMTIANQRAIEETTARSQKLAAEAVKRPPSITCLAFFATCPQSQGAAQGAAQIETQPQIQSQPQKIPAPYYPSN